MHPERTPKAMEKTFYAYWMYFYIGIFSAMPIDYCNQCQEHCFIPITQHCFML